jgi:hypothetical protein
MDDNIKSFIKTNAFLGFEIIVDENMGVFKCPKIDDLKENLVIYIHLINKLIDLYEDNKNNFYYTLFSDATLFKDFITILYFFFDIKELKLNDGKIVLSDDHFISEANIGLFMETLRILHHFDKKDDDYKPLNKIAAEMMERARKLRKEVEAKIKNKDGVGFLEIMSTVSARHASINPTNIKQLNYYQIIDQYKRLLMIDMYLPCLYGNATEEYIKNNNVKHYSVKIENEN